MSMSWISNQLNQRTPTKPTRISEPQISDPLESLRSGQLGSGATVVRTPMEALAKMRSPPLPPVPLPDENPISPPASPRKSEVRPLKPVLKTSASTVPEFLPEFSPVLLAPVSQAKVDASQIIVSLETETSTYRTTLATITSRPSRLARYCKSLLRGRVPSSASELECGHFFNDSDSEVDELEDEYEENNHAEQQIVPRIHLFVDRPSDPYAHVLAYLRNPSAGLPHMLRHSTSIDLLESVLEEARYLGIDSLASLLSRPTHSRGASSTSEQPHTMPTPITPPKMISHMRGYSNYSVHSGHSRSTSDLLTRPPAPTCPLPELPPHPADFASPSCVRVQPASPERSMRQRSNGNWI